MATSSLLPQLRFIPVDGNGSPYSGGKLYTYVSGTTTNQATYSDSALTTPNANPVVADTNGLFGAIYLDPSLTYKFVLKTSADATVWTQDLVSAGSISLLSVLSKTANYTVATGDGDDVIVLADATSASFTVTLYTAVGNSGRKVRVIKTDSTANTVTVDPNGSQTIDGITTFVLYGQYDALSVVSNGTNWNSFAQVVRPQVLTKSADYTVVATTDGRLPWILMSATGASRTVTLPASAGLIGQRIGVKKTDSSANTVTVDGNASETIDGAATYVIAGQYDYVLLESDNTNWWIVARYAQTPSFNGLTLTGDMNAGNNNVYFTQTANGNSGATFTVNWLNSNKQAVTLSANCTFTFTSPNGPSSLVLRLAQDSTGSRTVTWPATVIWPSGTAPVLTTTVSRVDLIAFYWDGTNYFGTSSLNYAV